MENVKIQEASEYQVNGKKFYTKAAADAYVKELDARKNDTKRDILAEDATPKWIFHVRWQLAALLISYAGPETFGRFSHGDPIVMGAVAYLISATCAAGISFVLYVFFTKSIQSKATTLFGVLSAFIATLATIGGWINYNRLF